MIKKEKNGELVKEVTNSTEMKFITFDELKRISDENFGRFNRNVNYERIQSKYPVIEDSVFLIIKLIEPFQYMGKQKDIHYKCLVLTPFETKTLTEILLQDVSLEQWENIQN